MKCAFKPLIRFAKRYFSEERRTVCGDDDDAGGDIAHLWK